MDELTGSAAEHENNGSAAEDDALLSDLRTVVVSVGTDQAGRVATRIGLVHKRDVGKVMDLLDTLQR